MSKSRTWAVMAVMAALLAGPAAAQGAHASVELRVDESTAARDDEAASGGFVVDEVSYAVSGRRLTGVSFSSLPAGRAAAAWFGARGPGSPALFSCAMTETRWTCASPAGIELGLADLLVVRIDGELASIGGGSSQPATSGGGSQAGSGEPARPEPDVPLALPSTGARTQALLLVALAALSAGWLAVVAGRRRARAR